MSPATPQITKERKGPVITLADDTFVSSITAQPLKYVSGNPFEQIDDGLVIHPEFMEVGQLYPVTLLGEQVVAVKREDDSIDFYSVS